MSVPVCIQNRILIEIDSKFQKEILTNNGISLYRDSHYRPEWNVTIKGKVVSVPKKLNIGGGLDSIFPHRPLIEQIVQPGDEIVFSYLVVMQRETTENKEEQFIKEPDYKYPVPGMDVWKNGRGQTIIRQYNNNLTWDVGLVENETQKVLDHVNGGESEMENFLSKYFVSQNISYKYKNVFISPEDGSEYWMVDYPYVFGIKREGRYEMVGGYVMIEPISEPKDEIYKGIIQIHQIEQSKDYLAKGRVMYIGEPLKGKERLNVKEGDEIILDSRFIEKYEIDGKDVWISAQDRLLYNQTV